MATRKRKPEPQEPAISPEVDAFESQVKAITRLAAPMKPKKDVVFDKEQVAEVLEHIARGGFLRPKLMGMGLSVAAWYRRLHENPELTEAYEAARELAATRYQNMGDSLAMDGKPTAWAQFQLAKRMPKTFGDKSQVEVNVTHSARIVGRSMTVEEAERFASEEDE